jgi:membrane associated rhomboid family serine protease
MQKQKKYLFGSSLESIVYPILLLLVMWIVIWSEHLFSTFDFYRFGVEPRKISGLVGIIFMPLIHSDSDFSHIINNSGPTFILLCALIYFYHEIALKVFIWSWLLTGVFVWLLGKNGFHIGMSGVIYALASFLFTSGVLRKYLPLQAISMMVVFLYGSMVWGILPMEEKISWEGHLSGMVIGIFLAISFKKEGPIRPKYQYEIEKEMGIEPPDYEALLNEKLAQLKAQEEEERKQLEHRIVYHYHYVPKEAINSKPEDGSVQ